jgi:hypothetical protein
MFELFTKSIIYYKKLLKKIFPKFFIYNILIHTLHIIYFYYIFSFLHSIPVFNGSVPSAGSYLRWLNRVPIDANADPIMCLDSPEILCSFPIPEPNLKKLLI